MEDRQTTPEAAERAAATGTEADGAGTNGAGAEADGAGTDGAGAGATVGAEEVQEAIREALRAVKDPELGVNIVDLGLVYDIEVQESGVAKITMTLTSPGCPAGGQILSGAKNAAEEVVGVDAAQVNLVWKPFWTPDRIDPKVRAALGF